MCSFENLHKTLQLLASISQRASESKKPFEVMIKEFEKHKLSAPHLTEEQLQAFVDVGLPPQYFQQLLTPEWVVEMLNSLQRIYCAPAARAFAQAQLKQIRAQK